MRRVIWIAALVGCLPAVDLADDDGIVTGSATCGDVGLVQVGAWEGLAVQVWICREPCEPAPLVWDEAADDYLVTCKPGELVRVLGVGDVE